MSDFVDVGALSPEARKALEVWILGLADSKRLMGIRYSDWILGAPSIETGIATSSMAQDEWGHARLLYAMLKTLGIDPVPVEHDRPAEAYCNVGALDAPAEDWADEVACMAVVDGALSVALDAFGSGRFEPAAQRVPKMLAEEDFHASLADAWFRRLADGTDEARTRLAEATRRVLPSVLAWLGTEDGPRRVLVEEGIIRAPGESAGVFRDTLRELLAVGGLELDDVMPEEGWDPERGRGPGRPDDDAVERARGDRNRALFVE